MADRDPVIERLFPALIGHYRVSSDPDTKYNCVAWAAGDDKQWWQVFPNDRYYAVGGYHWPRTVARENTVAGWAAMFGTLGYTILTDASRAGD